MKQAECWLCETSAEQHEEHDRHLKDSPVKEYRTIIQDSNDPGYVNRLLIATPTIGNVRIEWVQSRYGQVIPTNWSMVQMLQFMSSYIPVRYQVHDAQNLIARAMIEGEFEWLLLIEDDVLIPPDTFIRINEYMRKGDIPIVSGLYYTKSIPPEPMIYRGRGTSYFTEWKRGDRVWVDGVPTGLLLIHGSIIKAMWEESEEYMLGDVKTRRVFDNPRKLWIDKETGQFNTITGTSDLAWCTRVMEQKFFEKAGWEKHRKKHPKFPFLCDTGIFADQVDLQGRRYPSSVVLVSYNEISEKELKNK